MSGDCVTYPGRPGSPGRAGYIDYKPDFGWDAGANSSAQINGPCILDFTVPNPVGVLIGLTDVLNQFLNPHTYFHALLFQTAGGLSTWSVLERGVVVQAAQVRTFTTTDENGQPADDFSIERTGNSVNYYMNGTIVLVRPCLFTGIALVSAMLYASGDYVG
jgi:hypothetical protein